MFRLKTPQLIAQLTIVVMIGAFFMLGACRSTKPLVPTVTDSTSTFTKTVERDTTIVSPGAKARLTVSPENLFAAIKLDLTNSQAAKANQGTSAYKPVAVTLGSNKVAHANASASIQNGSLQVECSCDSTAIAAKLLDKYMQTDRVRTVQLPPIQVKYVPWYITALAWLGGISLIFIGVLAFIGIKRKIRK